MNSSMMQFDGVAIIFAVIAILCLLMGYKLLSSSSWVSGWLRGNIGIILILCTGFFALCVLDIRSYKPMFDEKTVATLSFRETSPGRYEARIVDALGVESRYSVAGDHWYLSANQFKWSKRLSLGMGHGYRFNTITGLHKKTAGTVTIDTISQSHYFDVWMFINNHISNGFLVSAETVVTLPQPLADAAMYEVMPLGLELIVKPLNEFAKKAQMAAALDPNLLLEPESKGDAVSTTMPLTPAPVSDVVSSSVPIETPAVKVTPVSQDKPAAVQ